jgi:hypothetical protein
MAIFGWDTLKMAEAYTRSADQQRLAEAAMHMLGSPEQNGTKSCPTEVPSGTISEKRSAKSDVNFEGGARDYALCRFPGDVWRAATMATPPRKLIHHKVVCAIIARRPLTRADATDRVHHRCDVPADLASKPSDHRYPEHLWVARSRPLRTSTIRQRLWARDVSGDHPHARRPSDIANVSGTVREKSRAAHRRIFPKKRAGA